MNGPIFVHGKFDDYRLAIARLNQRTESVSEGSIEYEYEYRDAEYEYEGMPEPRNEARSSNASTYEIGPIPSDWAIPGEIHRYRNEDESLSDDVRWLYLGCRSCGLVGCYADWKNEFNGYEKLLAMM